MESNDCAACRGYHGVLNRHEALTKLAASWHAGDAWFVPMCGRKLLEAAPFMDGVASMLYLDGGEVVNEVMEVGPGAIGMMVPALTGFGDPVEKLSGVYTIPVTAPLVKMQQAFPGHFETGLPDAKILLVASLDEAFGSGVVEFAPLMLDIVAEADPVQAIEMLQGMTTEPQE